MHRNKDAILAQKPLALTQKIRLRWVVALSSLPLFGMVAAFGIAPQNAVDNVPVTNVIEALPIPSVANPAETDMALWRHERVQRGDTVAALLSRLNIDGQEAIDFLRTASTARSLRQLVPGKFVQAKTSEDGELLWLSYLNGSGTQFVVEKGAGGFVASEQPAQLEQRIVMKSGEIVSSLFAATDAANVPDNIAVQIADIFASDIDFHRDLRKGDHFTVVYEISYSDGEPVKTGRVLAAEFVNQGKAYRAIYFQAPDGSGGFYTPEGKNLRKAFLRSPLEFSRISSGFSSARFHPVLKEWRAHRGIDYAAPTGARVKATADGTVVFAGRHGGYGNLVIVQHQGQYITAYGHLSAFAKGLRKGMKVGQGDVIGYVGMTGLATGPHLHYEFRVNDVQRDPLRVAMPAATPVAPQFLGAFQTSAKPLLVRLEMLRNTKLASLD